MSTKRQPLASTIRVDLPKELKRQLESLAAERQWTLAQLVRETFLEYINNHVDGTKP